MCEASSKVWGTVGSWPRLVQVRDELGVPTLGGRALRKRIKNLGIIIGGVNRGRVRTARDEVFEAFCSGAFYTETDFAPAAEEARAIREKIALVRANERAMDTRPSWQQYTPPSGGGGDGGGDDVDDDDDDDNDDAEGDKGLLSPVLSDSIILIHVCKY